MPRRNVARMVRSVGLQLVRHTGQFDITPRRIRRLRDLGVKLKLAIDGGAASGMWADELKMIFPEVEVLCIEPRDDAQSALQALALRLPGIHIAQVLVGDKDDNVEFYEQADQSSIMPVARGNPMGQMTHIRMTTLDRLVSSLALPDPDLIKLDLQGAELICLKGADRCLSKAQFVILETSLIPLYEGTPSVAEIMTFMNTKGFRLYDILSLWHRPLDGATTSGDFLFIKEGHELVADSRWSEKVKWERSLLK